MQDMKELWNYYRDHKTAGLMLIVATLVGLVAGGALGALAYYNGWLG